MPRQSAGFGRRSLLAKAAAAPALPIALASAKAANAASGVNPDAQGVAVAQDMLPAGQMEVIAALPDPGPSGIAVTPDGRVFISLPRHAQDHDQPTLNELRDGRLTAFPDAETTRPSALPPEEKLISLHGLTTDTRGRLWGIDDGKIAGKPLQPGAAKVVGFDPASGRRIASLVLKSPALLPDSHMNDLRVDLTHGAQGVVYVADSSFGTSPALVVIDIATGRQQRVLSGHPSIVAEKGFVAVLEGKPRRYQEQHAQFPTGGVDSITLSTDSATLYYSPLTSRRLYSLPTALLSNFDATEAQLAAAVVDLGEKVMTDGLATDPWNRIYLTAGEHDAIMRRNVDGSIDVIARDRRIVWPDGIFATNRHVYCVLGQWNRLPAMNGGHNLRQPPYLIVRCPIAPPVG